MSEPLTVALCDDSGIFRQGVAMLLEASGIVVTASTGSGPELQAVLRERASPGRGAVGHADAADPH